MTNNQQPNSILNRLLNDMDEMQTSRHPLQPHGIVNLQEDEKRLYATFLATLLIDQPVSMAQSRLLTMLLESMNLSIQLADLYASVAEVDKTKLQAFLTLADEKGLSPVFLMDALVLCRLDKSLTENQAKSLAEFVNLMSVDDAMLADAVHLSNKVLRYQKNNENAVADAIKDKTSLTIDFDYELLKHWHEFSYKPLEDSSLLKNLSNNQWLVFGKLQSDEPIIIDSAVIYFSKQSEIKLNCEKFVVRKSLISGMNLKSENDYNKRIKEDVKMSLSEFGIFELSQSTFVNSIFSINNTNLSIDGCKFENNTRFNDSLLGVFKLKKIQGLSKIDNSEFRLNSVPAIYTTDKLELNVSHSKFVGGFVESKGAIYLKCINTSVTNFEDAALKIVGSSDGFNIDINNCYFEGLNKIEFSNWIKFEKIPKAISLVDRQLKPSDKDDYEHFYVTKSQFKNSAICFKFYKTWEIKYPYYQPIEQCKLENSPIFCNSVQEDKVFLNCELKNSENPNLVWTET